MLIKMLKRRRTKDSLLDNALEDIYPDEHEFLVNDRPHSRHRVPAYKAAIIRKSSLPYVVCDRLTAEQKVADPMNIYYHCFPPVNLSTLFCLYTVCQLQLKLCSKMMELRSTSNSKCNEEPSTLKRIAKKSILRHSLRDCSGTISLLECDQTENEEFNIREVLPGELIEYLRDGTHD